MSSTHPHITPLKVYFLVFATLIAGTWLTYFVAYKDFGWLNTPVAMAIAIVKAGVVVLYFMHVKWQSRLTMMFAAGGFIWLFTLFAFTLQDYFTRSWMPLYQ
ncbi:MAG: cytochrome C oxidase subunit IV family protein [Planctomycetes bacterium]|nr:cytochrome C oxidase subunit IV family protein [Planctomycetota bacterium]